MLNFFDALILKLKQRKNSSHETTFSTVNRRIVPRRDSSLCAGNQKPSCRRRIDVTVVATHHRVVNPSRDHCPTGKPRQIAQNRIEPLGRDAALRSPHIAAQYPTSL
jgi:hypothetical protein